MLRSAVAPLGLKMKGYTEEVKIVPFSNTGMKYSSVCVNSSWSALVLFVLRALMLLLRRVAQQVPLALFLPLICFSARDGTGDMF